VDFDNDTLLPDDPALWANQSEAALSASFGGNLISVVVAGADGSQRRGLVGLYQIDSFDAQSYTLVSFVQNNDGTFSASDETFDLAFRVSGGQPLAGGLYEQRFGAGADGGVGAREFRIGFSSGGIGFSTTSLTIDLSGLRLISGATPTVPTDFTVSGIEDRSRARGALDAVQSEVATLAQTRSRVGADQSRLNFAALLAKSSSVVAAAAEGRIRDADIAAETARLTQVQILQQAAVSVLQRANLDPQLALNLLRN
jgi:flagellin-like hook-associated protein FlgL